MTALKAKLSGLIGAQGPMSVAQFMQIALGDPEHGYYMRADPLGRDFITAPEISQLFGELIGLFLVQAWEDRGRPAAFALVELGPGRGTLMADMLRAASRVRPAFTSGAQITLVETSPALRAAQQHALADYAVGWSSSLSDLQTDMPLFLVANEFFDALPIRQFVAAPDGWHERRIACDGDKLQFVVAPEPLPADVSGRGEQAALGAIVERNFAAESIVSDIAAWIARHGGTALAIDYGHAQSGFGDTLQSVRAHRFAEVLEAPGSADITAHVDFAALARAARESGAQVSGPATQRMFLNALGIGLRGERLKQAQPDHAGEIDAAIDRLTGEAQMGTLFKVLAISQAGSPALPGF